MSRLATSLISVCAFINCKIDPGDVTKTNLTKLLRDAGGSRLNEGKNRAKANIKEKNLTRGKGQKNLHSQINKYNWYLPAR